MPRGLRTGERIQFIRKNYAAKRLNGRTAEVLAINAEEGLVVVGMKGGKRQTLDMSNVADRHIRPAWVSTIYAAQGATCDRVMAHLESFRRNVDANLAYVPCRGPRSTPPSTPMIATASPPPSRAATAPRSARSTRR